jgi:bifunctional DNA-binding transcriptional regulator/antitoxin component of YhaV-PrlF toxin-antitoxin module
MNAKRIFFSTLSVGWKTVVPRHVCEYLDLKPGDALRFRATECGILLDKAETTDPFATFSEWWGEADDKAFARL